MRKILQLITQPMFYPAILTIFLVLTTITNVLAQENDDQKEANTTQNVSNELYSYVMEGRADPFKPFISPKAATPAGADPNEIIDENNELTGLRLFEPGQLTLVGVLMSGTGEIAMVEDETKKGYFLKQGDPIGKRGIVTQIDKQQIVVTETAHTRAGKEINSTVIMRLKKEGDK